MPGVTPYSAVVPPQGGQYVDSELAFFICEVVMRVPRFLKTKIGWALIIALAAAAGLKLTPEQKAAIEQHGPELATEIENAAND